MTTHDIVLLGATGFVGRLTAAYLAENAGPDVRIALAGRSREKLESARRQLPEAAREWPLEIVDVSDMEACERVAASTKVLVTTVGPYAAYGKNIARACAEAGTDYCDLTGETLFVRWSLDALARNARQSGARIVHSCGFDSVPSDLGVLMTARAAADAGAGTLTRTLLSVRALKGGFSGGTIDSMRQQAITMRKEKQARAILTDPYSLSPDRPSEPKGREGLEDVPGGAPARGRSIAGASRDPRTGRWHGPFVMASYNTRVVRMSNALQKWAYGRGFRYNEVTDFGSSAKAPVLAAGTGLGLGTVFAGMSVAPTRALLDRVLPKPGEGPSEEAMRAGRFVMDIEADTTSGRTFRTRVAADKDPGYTGTAVMLGEAALCLLQDRDRTPQVSGVLTPAVALGEPYVERLRAREFTFDTREVDAEATPAASENA